MLKIPCRDHFGKSHTFDASEYLDREAMYGILIKDGDVLLVKDNKSNQWEIPGGGKEENESDQDCLQREFFEETGMKIATILEKQSEYISYFYDIVSQQPWKTLRKYYLVTSQDTNPLDRGNNIDIAEVKFHSVANLANISIPEKTRSILEALP